MSPRRAAVLRGRDQSLREHLVTAAERLISRHGTAGLTVRDIAREAQVAVGVLYNHFADKEELLAHALHAHVRSVQRTLEEPPRRPGAGTVEENLRAYVAHGLALYAVTLPAFAGLLARPEVLSRFAGLPARPAALTRFAGLPDPMEGGLGLRATLAGYLRAERDLGRLAPDAAIDTAAAMIVGACHEVVLPQLFGGAPRTEIDVPEGFVDDLVTAIMKGIAPAGGAGAG
jgi:AcrR family transcriptional regulator